MPATGPQRENSYQNRQNASNNDSDEKNIYKFLYVEDYYFQRDVVVQLLNDKDYRDIIAPESLEECVNALKSRQFSHAILDYHLEHWVGKGNQNVIKPNGAECYNGAEIALFLKEYGQDLQIVLFSSDQGTLNKVYDSLPNKEGISMLPRRSAHLADDIICYIEDSHKIEIVVKPLHKITGDLPNEIKAFYAKKIINSFEKGEDKWKAGKYVWVAGVNTDISSHYDEIGQSDEYTSDNPKESFVLNINKDGSGLESIIDESANLEINFNNFETDSPTYKSDSLIHKYFTTQAVCKKYLAQEITTNEAVNAIKLLGEYAMFESQKILFKKLAQNTNLQVSRKEDIYELLEGFRLKGFPKILEIFEGRVDSIKDGIGAVKLTSISPKKVVKTVRFSSEFLSKHHILNEDCNFEYTVYVTSIGGGTAYQIEPVDL